MIDITDQGIESDSSATLPFTLSSFSCLVLVTTNPIVNLYTPFYFSGLLSSGLPVSPLFSFAPNLARISVDGPKSGLEQSACSKVI